MPPRSSSQGESKQGLIITLVFFVLATLCLGVSTYYGFADQDAKDKAKKKAEDEAKIFKDERDYYKAQAMVFRGYMGLTEGMDGADTLGTLKNQLDGSLGKNSKDYADVTKVLKSLETTYGWSGNQPQKTLDGQIKNLTTQNENLSNLSARLDRELKAAKKELQNREEELRVAQEDYKKKLEKNKADYTQEFEKLSDDYKKLREAFAQLSQEREKEKTDSATKQEELAKSITHLQNVDIKNLKELVRRREEERDQFKTRNPEAPPNMRTDWKIVKMDDRGTHPYINLGSADHVKPQLTFSIYGLGSDGRPYPQPKGTLEVVSVVGPHLSQARVTSVKDRNRDPIVERDVIYNASWNPNLKKHVAIAGVVDLTGDGRDSLMEFIRNLQRQNIVVDAYEDPNNGTIVGQMSYQTDYLILGPTPDPMGGGKQGEAGKRILEGRKQIQDEAKKYGVPVKNLTSYLEMIGYPLPHTVQERRPPSRYGSDTDSRSDIVPRLGRDKLVPKNPVKEQPQGDMPPDK